MTEKGRSYLPNDLPADIVQEMRAAFGPIEQEHVQAPTDKKPSGVAPARMGPAGWEPLKSVPRAQTEATPITRKTSGDVFVAKPAPKLIGPRPARIGRRPSM